MTSLPIFHHLKKMKKDNYFAIRLSLQHLLDNQLPDQVSGSTPILPKTAIKSASNDTSTSAINSKNAQTWPNVENGVTVPPEITLIQISEYVLVTRVMISHLNSEVYCIKNKRFKKIKKIENTAGSSSLMVLVV
jgi:hypothetical protein